MATSIKNLSKKDKIGWILVILVAAIFLAIPCTEFYTPQMKYFLAITVACVIGFAFELLPTVVIAALMPGLWYMTGVAPMNTIMSGWLQDTNYMILGALVLSMGLQENGLMFRIAYWFLAKADGSYMKLLFLIFIAGAVLTIMTFGYAAATMAALCLGMVLALDLKDTKAGAGVAMAGLLGGAAANGAIYCATSYGVLAGMQRQVVPDIQVTLGGSMLHNVPIWIALIVALVITAKWYKAEKPIDGKAYFEERLASMGKITPAERNGAIIAILMMVLLLTTKYTGLSTGKVFMVLPWLMFLPGINAATPKCLKNVPIDQLIFVASCMAIGTLASQMGFGPLVAQIMAPFISGEYGIVAMFAFIYIAIAIVNILMTPMAFWALLAVPLTTAVVGMGMDPLTMTYALTHGAYILIFPFEYTLFLTFYAFGVMKMGDFIKLNAMRSAILFVVLMVLVLPWWKFLGLLG